MFGYEFVDLTAEQVEARRKLLRLAGTHGYLLPIILLSTVSFFRILSTVRTSDDSKRSSQKPGVLRLYYRRLRWLLGNTYVAEFGPLHVQLFGLAYASALLYLIFRGTGNDYMHLTKAFAHVTVSQLPVHYLLSVKHPQNPAVLASGLSHERLNAYHRLSGRILHVLLITHGVLYVWFFIAKGIIGKRINDWDVRYGLMALASMDLIGVLSIPSIRKKVYHKVFYRSHVALSLLLSIAVWLHVPYTRFYVAQAALIWIANGILRRGSMGEDGTVKCKKVSDGLVEVTATLGGGLNWEEWVPGMHGYLSQSSLGPRSPFTVVDARMKNRSVELCFVVRDLGGPMTGLLGQAAAHDKSLNLEIEGPYGDAKQYLPDVLNQTSQPILVVAGGVGATYSLPIYLALAEKRRDAAQLRFIWIVKSLSDAKWGLEMLRGKPNRNVHIYVTHGKGDDKAIKAFAQPGIEIFATGTRPNLTKTVESFLDSPEKTGQPVSVLVCGPGGLSTDLRRAVETYALNGRKIRWYEEQFGFGGS